MSFPYSEVLAEVLNYTGLSLPSLPLSPLSAASDISTEPSDDEESKYVEKPPKNVQYEN